MAIRRDRLSVMDWLKYIKYLETDIPDLKSKPHLRVAIRSHCETRAKFQGLSHEGIAEALDKFYEV